MSACVGCGRRVYLLPYMEGAGDYCTAACRWLSEFTESWVPFALPGDRPCQHPQCGKIILADGSSLAVKDSAGNLICAEHHVTDQYELAA